MMRRPDHHPGMTQLTLPTFDALPRHQVDKPMFPGIRRALWTENKAKLVANYLGYFVYITKHGCYIDGFAGPRQAGVTGSWAAEQVLAREPKLLREFFLCDQDTEKVAALEEMKARQPEVRGRDIRVLPGDFNITVDHILASGVVTERKATFCLLDQFTAECHWETVRKLASHKKEGTKIEVFYFLASGWIDRALAGFTKNIDIPEAWWGRGDWASLQGLHSQRRAEMVCDRFRRELGYAYANAWPILERGDSGRVMFHMIHATDHPEAPKLMVRAYRAASLEPEAARQIEMNLDDFASIRDAYGE